MRTALKSCLVLLFSACLVAQMAPGGSAQPAKKKRGSAVTAEDVRELRQALAAQQQQIQQMQEEMRRRDQLLEQMQQALARAQTVASSAQEKAVAAQSFASQQGESVSRIQGDLADVKLNQTNAAASTQEDQKRVSKLEDTLGRFRLSGDVRVRYENFLFGYDGCVSPDCNPRQRARIRLRLGIEGKLNEDFSAGMYLASGALAGGAPSLSDPISTNETLTGFFERKTVGFDRGWITYNPQAHKWLNLTAGKFAYTWIRTPLTMDNDLNPEGASERFSFDFSHPHFKNFTVTAMQLFFNEVSNKADSFAAGAQVSARLQLGKRWTMTPSYSLLNWRNANSIAAAIKAKSLSGGFANTNATDPGKDVFLSKFLYSDLILDNNVVTPWKRFPLRLLLEYEQNLNAVPSAVTGTKQDKAYWFETALGQLKEKNDIQFGYSFGRVDQDAVISAFNESDLRAQTNIIQHRLFFNWLPQKNTTVAWTWWIGRTANVNLPNAAKPTGLPPGERDPYLKRMQLDLTYKF